jgi:hypothetical protein
MQPKRTPGGLNTDSKGIMMQSESANTATNLTFPLSWNGYQIQHVFNSNGTQYGTDEYGVIHQMNPQPYTYDAAYVSTYDTPEYQRQSDILQALRLGFVVGAFGRVPRKLLDFGAGNGAFMRFAIQRVKIVFGYDVAGAGVPGVFSDLHTAYTAFDGREFDVITFWDALEHVPDLSFVRDLPCKMVVISLPWCHYAALGQQWFDNEYYHRKPSEHLHHFNYESLEAFMKSCGWNKVADSDHEDIVRKPRYSNKHISNILTMAFKRK